MQLQNAEKYHRVYNSVVVPCVSGVSLLEYITAVEVHGSATHAKLCSA